MNTPSPRSLDVRPSESRCNLSEVNSYTVRIPHQMFLGDRRAVLDCLRDTAGVAFSGNPGKKGPIIFSHPVSSSSSVTPFVESLSFVSDQVRTRPLPDSKFLPTRNIQSYEVCCVDRRMDDRGANGITGRAQLTHPGGLIALNPLFDGHDLPSHHQEFLRRALEYVHGSGAPVGQIDHHFGTDGASGCGMVRHLQTVYPQLQPFLRTPELIYDGLARVRDRYAHVLAPGCRLTASAIDPNDDAVVYDLDDESDREVFFGERNLTV